MGKSAISILLITFFLLASDNVNAGSVGGFGGSLEITQILNNIELMQTNVQEVLQVQNQIQQITNQLQMYQNMLTNTQSLVGQPFQNATQTLLQLKNAIDQATQLSYTVAATDQYFTRLNPDYGTLFQGNNYAQQQQYWRTNVYDYCEATLKTANFEMNNAQTESQLLQDLQQRSQTVVGQKEAIQAGNEIALQMVAQMDRLKLLTAAQAQSQSVYLSQEKAEKEANEESVKDLYQYDPNVTNPNNNATF